MDAWVPPNLAMAAKSKLILQLLELVFYPHPNWQRPQASQKKMASRLMNLVAHPRPMSMPQVIAHPSPTRANASVLKAFKMQSIRRKMLPQISWAKTFHMFQCHGSGQINTTSNCRSRG